MRGRLFIILLAFALVSCGKKGNNGADPTPTPPVKNPIAAVLTFPEKNAVCTQGDAGPTITQSTIAFIWADAGNADSYDIYIKNLLTSAVITRSVSAAGTSVVLAKNTPYSWYVVSKSKNTSVTAQSETWKFYNAGDGVISYPPYPADAVSPLWQAKVIAVNGTINLSWKGSAIPGSTIANYDVYIGTTVTPVIFKEKVTDSFANNVPVKTNTTYYWQILTRDTNGNVSYSDVFQFTVN